MAQVKFLIIALFSITIQSQEFDFSCATELEGYVSDWFDDAETNGLVYQRNGIIDWVSNSTRTFDPDKQFAGVSINSCVDGYEVYIKKSYWDDPDVTEAEKKHLIYHEMGHAVLEYAHVCNNPLPSNLETSHAACFNNPGHPNNIIWIWNDIMRTSENCPYHNRCTNPTIDSYRYNRYWVGTDQINITCTNTNKGIDIIYD